MLGGIILGSSIGYLFGLGTIKLNEFIAQKNITNK
jgi:hypothetical protein